MYYLELLRHMVHLRIMWCCVAKLVFPCTPKESSYSRSVRSPLTLTQWQSITSHPQHHHCECPNSHNACRVLKLKQWMPHEFWEIWYYRQERMWTVDIAIEMFTRLPTFMKYMKLHHFCHKSYLTSSDSSTLCINTKNLKESCWAAVMICLWTDGVHITDCNSTAW